MDVLTFLLKAIELLVWPVVFVVFICVFRTPLSGLIDALKNATVRYKSGTTTLEAKLDTVREQLRQIPPEPVPKRVEQLAHESPPKAVEAAWNDLYDRARTSLSATDMIAPFDAAGLLAQRHMLDKNEAIAFYRLSELKDEVIKPGSTVVTDVSSSAAYGSLAYTLAEKILPKNEG